MEFIKIYPNRKARQIILGSILGDGHLYRSTCVIGHRLKDKDYIFWKHKELGDLFPNPPTLATVNSFGNRNYQYWRLTSIGSSIFDEYHRKIYRNGRKAITREVLDELEELGVAVWYMDDGSLSCLMKSFRYPHVRISTAGFGLEGNKIIMEWFKDRWGILFNILYCPETKRSTHITKENWILSITRKREVEKFMELVEPHIVPCMRRKSLKWRKQQTPRFHKEEEFGFSDYKPD